MEKRSGVSGWKVLCFQSLASYVWMLGSHVVAHEGSEMVDLFVDRPFWRYFGWRDKAGACRKPAGHGTAEGAGMKRG